MKSNTKTAEAFRRVARRILFADTSAETAESYDLLNRLHNLTRLGSDMLALLLTSRIGETDFSEPCRHLAISRRCADEMWRKLAENGYVRRTSRSGPPSHGYRPDLALCVAVENDRPIALVQQTIQQDLFVKTVQSLAFDGIQVAETPRMNGSEPPKTYRPGDVDFPDEALDATGQKTKCGHVRPFGAVAAVDAITGLYPRSSFAKTMNSLTDALDDCPRFLLYGLMGWFAGEFIRPVSGSMFTGELGTAFDLGLSTLVERGLATSVYQWNDQNKTSGSDNYRITPRCAEVFKGREEVIRTECLSAYGTYTPASAIERKELFFPESDRKGIHRLRSAVSVEKYDRIVAELRKRGLRPNLSALLYGPPGTGKTEVARQMALESGRGILAADIPKLFGIYIGEGSIHLKDLFLTYRYVCSVSRTCPILFMDEADGVLGRRVSGMNSSADKDANACASVILEELNSLPGVLVATTNLIGNLDDAMVRRFSIKAEFHLPDAPTRERLWRSRFPFLSGEESTDLAGRYAISAAQMDNVLAEATMDEIIDERPVSAEDLAGYCEELGYGDPCRKRIGF